jgi:G protein-coupled receptor GPR1
MIWGPVPLLICTSMIMLLIQSDMFKALWFMMYPIVTFAKGPVPNSSKFCQVNGFFLSVGIEASG